MTNQTNNPILPTLDARITGILRYWDRLRGDRVAPGRVEINPAEITRHLSRICILERPRAGTVRMRLAGTTISSRMGMELRGMPLRSLFDLDHRNTAMDAAETAMTTPLVSILSLSRAERAGPQPEAMLAILPLTDTLGGLTRAIAIYSERPSVTPFVTNLRGRFLVQDRWMLDIPESGPILSTATGAIPLPQMVFRPRLAKTNLQPQMQNARPDPHAMEHPARPVFQVIEGGRA